MGSLEGKVISMQGTGNVARTMIEILLSKNIEKIIATEINPKAIEEAVKLVNRDPRLEVIQVQRGDNSVSSIQSDVFVPNALGGILNPETIPKTGKSQSRHLIA